MEKAKCSCLMRSALDIEARLAAGVNDKSGDGRRA